MQLSHPPRLCTLTLLALIQQRHQTQQPQKLSTVQLSLKVSLGFGAAPQQQNSRHSAVREAEFYLKAALLQMVTIKPSQCFPPVLSPNTLWDPGLGAPLKAGLNLVYGHKTNTCQCQMLQKEQLFSWPHFLLPAHLRHAKKRPCSKRWVTNKPQALAQNYHVVFYTQWCGTFVYSGNSSVSQRGTSPSHPHSGMGCDELLCVFSSCKGSWCSVQMGPSSFIHSELSFLLVQTQCCLSFWCHHYVATAPKGSTWTHQAQTPKSPPKLLLSQLSGVCHTKYSLNFVLGTLPPLCFPWVW